jgi:glycosyltransferase involved in cell wall biosynthesis
LPKLIRITTVPIALQYLLEGQMRFMQVNGFEVIMVSADGQGREQVIANEKCPHHIIPMTRKITPFADLISLWKLYRFFKKERPDIVHSHTPKAGLLAMMAAKWAGVKVRVHTIAGLRFRTSGGITRRVLVAMEKLTARYATQVWPNSFSLLKIIREMKLVAPQKLEVIGSGSSNGIDLNRFSRNVVRQDKLKEVKELVQYDEQLIYLLCVGRIVKDKGIDELLKAFTRAFEKNTKLRLILIGIFEDELDPVSNRSKKILQSHPGIIQAGWRDDVEYFMHFSYALLHPSYREGFPNVLLQAGAMQCPIVCSRIEGNIDVVDHEVTGLIFEPMNETDLYEKMEIALDNPQAIKQYALDLRSKIEQHFDRSILHARILERYKALILATEVNGNREEGKKRARPTF